MTKNVIQQRVEWAREGKFPQVIGRMPSGWLIVADTQPVQGYCQLLSDPIVPSLNDLQGQERMQYLADCVTVGDALLKATGAARINYETWCNQEPSLHTHIVPRYLTEADAVKTKPVCVGYAGISVRPFDLEQDTAFMEEMRKLLDIQS